MAIQKISDSLFIAPQLTDDDIREAVANGFRVIINNRPDAEEPGQPAISQQAAVAQTVGISYVHLPVAPGQITEERIRAFQSAVADADGPVLAHCKSGMRSAALHILGEVLDGRYNVDEAIALGKRVGFDLSGLLR